MGPGSTDQPSRAGPVRRDVGDLGIPYLFIRIAVEEITPAVLVFGRTAIAAGLLLPVALLRVDLRPVLARWRWVVAFAAIEIAIRGSCWPPQSSGCPAR